MGCTGRFSEAWEYITFWCKESIITGANESCFPGGPDLLDSDARFKTEGVVPNVGMILYNVTAGTSGEITAFTETTITATGVTWHENDIYRLVVITGKTIALIEHQLDITSSNIHAALAATGACDCTLAGWAVGYLAKLNILEAGVFHKCPCSRIPSPEDQREYLTFINDQLRLLRTGEIDVCSGQGGSEWPASGWVEQSVTEFNAARIILNSQLRRRS